MKNKLVFYVCDPEKNQACPKTSCKFNPSAKYQDCACTMHKKFAKRDCKGRPMIDRKVTRGANRTLWNKVSDEIRYRFYRVRRKLLNFLNGFGR